MIRALTAAIACGAIALAAEPAAADPTPLVGLAPPAIDDARRAIAIGPAGEVYEPDGAGAWTRTRRFATADTITRVGRAGRAVVAWGEGVVYKLAPNGWSALRLHQKDRSVMATGSRAVAAVKRQLYSLDRLRAGEPEKLAVAPAPVLAIGAGKSIVIATARGLLRVERGKITPIARAPKQVARLVDDRWAILARGAHDLRAGKTVAWPTTPAAVTMTVGTDGRLIAVATLRGKKLELWTIAKGKLDRETIDVTPGGTAVGVIVDRAGRAVVALSDGRLLLRNRGAWTTVTVSVALPAAKPGSPPATTGT